MKTFPPPRPLASRALRLASRLPVSGIACLVALAAAVPGPVAAEPGVERFDAADGCRVRVEAVSPGIVRILVGRGSDDRRETSLATLEAPAARSSLEVKKWGGRVLADSGKLAVEFSPARLTFNVRESGGGAPLVTGAALALDKGAGWHLSAPLLAGEEILGLGQDNHNNGRLDRRGVIRDLWAGQQITSGNVTAQYPVPFQINLMPDGRAFGLFVDNTHHLTYDLGKTDPGRYRLDAEGGDIDLYVIAGPSVAQVIERYTRLTGRPSLPPLWALGYWQSKCTYYDWKALDEAYAQLHARGFPVDVMVIDADWPEIQNDFQWARRWFADGAEPKAKIAGYARRDVHIVMSQSGPMIRQEAPTFASGWKAGVFATDGHGNPVECGYYGGKLLDFTSPRIDEWLWPQVRERIRDGVSGWWLDLTEPEGEPPQTVYHGGTPASVHNEYSLLSTISFEGAQLAENPDRRPWILTRCGSAGLQRHHAAVWTGDIYSDYPTYRAHPPEMLNSGLSGLAWWTCDTGGFLEGYYRNDQMGAHARLYERWMQFSAFSPITRAHKAGGAPEPYQFGPAVEQGCRHYLRLRYRLMPYIYSCAWEASRTGMPLVRPLALAFQDDPRSRTAPGDEYLFGPSLLVAPVLNEGVSNRSVYFPPGRWFDWDTGVEYEGGRDWVVAAPQNRIPVAVRAGAIIPMAPDMLATGERPWDPLTVEFFPSGRSSFTLYRDDGATFAYRKGEFTVTRLECDESRERVVLRIAESSHLFAPASYRLRAHLERLPVSVSSGGRPLEFRWDADARVLECALPSEGMLEHAVEIALDRRRLPRRPAPELELDRPDPKAEADGSLGRPMPHFFPAPSLPATIKAVNYDNGGEGVAYHSMRGLAAKAAYRPDDLGCALTADAGGGYVLAGLQAGEWARYSVDCGGGGHFDLGVRVASAKGGGRLRIVDQDRVVAVVEVPPTGGDDVFKDLTVPGVYLNPGQTSLLAYVEAPGFALNTFSLRPSEKSPAAYPAAEGRRAGVCDVVSPGGGSDGLGLLDKLGRMGSSLTLGVDAPAGGAYRLRLRFANHASKDVTLTVAVGEAPPVRLVLARNAPGVDWQTVELPVELRKGGNPVVFAGQEAGWDGVTLDRIERLDHR